jgi:hypothetical protein
MTFFTMVSEPRSRVIELPTVMEKVPPLVSMVTEAGV